jgi:preprotein translocase subunit YajC
MRGGLAMIILTYISILLFIGIFVLIIFNTQKKRQAKIQEGIEMVATKTYNRL